MAPSNEWDTNDADVAAMIADYYADEDQPDDAPRLYISEGDWD